MQSACSRVHVVTPIPQSKRTLPPDRACTGDRVEGAVDGRVNDTDENAPPIRASWAGPAVLHVQTGDDETSSKAIQAEVEARRNQDEKWLSMTTAEKRRQWLHRRKSGKFYFRSEFKGLVHVVSKNT